MTVPPGRLARLDLAGTALALVVTGLAAAVDADAVQLVYLYVCAGLFLVGSAVWAWGFVVAADRSRTHVIDLAGLFYLTGSAPRPVRRWFLGLWFAQIAIAVAAIPLTNPPWAVVVPVFGIGVLTRWASAHGTFPERPPPADPRRRRSGPE